MASKVSSTVFRKCIVLECGNTTLKSPEKTFILALRDDKRRKMWIKAARRHVSEFSDSTVPAVCEDHFNLGSDMENYWKWKLGGNKLIKKDVLPHIFHCQTPRKPMPTIRSVAINRERKVFLQAAVSDLPSSTIEQEASCSTLEEISRDRNVDITQDACSRKRRKYSDADEIPCSIRQMSSRQNVRDKRESGKCVRHTGIQVKQQYRSKAVQCNIQKHLVNKSCSPFKTEMFDTINGSKTSDTKWVEQLNSDSSFLRTSSSEYSLSITTAETTYSDSENANTELARAALDVTMKQIERNPRRYLGVAKESFFIIKSIQKYTGLNEIRIGQTFAELGDDFGISESSASRSFSKSKSPISQVMKKMIIWPSQAKIRELLPLPFRARYSHVQCIIDCLEIEIQKPTDAVSQALTWSEYKKCNTVKYLISSTPDGTINFISNGYGGRTSDAMIVENSGFINKMEQGTAVMADRGDEQSKLCSLALLISAAVKLSLLAKNSATIKESMRGKLSD